VHENSYSVQLEDAKQPRDEQNERDLQRLLASGTQAAPRETIGQLRNEWVSRRPTILIAGKMGARVIVERDDIRATPRNVFRLPGDDDRWDRFETREGPTRGRSANRACQLASSWCRNDDHEDGGPTIQLPAAEARCTLRSPSCVQYKRLRPRARTTALQRCSSDVLLVGPWSY